MISNTAGRRFTGLIKAAIYLGLAIAAVVVLTRIKSSQAPAVLVDKEPKPRWRLGTTLPELQRAIEANDGPAVLRIIRSAPKSAVRASIVQDAALDRTSSALAAILESGLDPNGGRRLGAPLIMAAYGGQVKAAAVLLEHGANPNLRPPSLPPALFVAYTTKINSTALVKLFLRHGAKIDRDGAIRSLDWACQSKNSDALKLLLKHGLPANLPEPHLPPLVFAATGNDQLHAIPLLCDAGADVNASFAIVDLTGRPVRVLRQTLIHMMAKRGDAEVVRLLLQRGADPKKRASDGTDAFEVATKQVREALVGTTIQAVGVSPQSK